ncbi:MAG: FecR domain-containing protein [Proteobacteria bacterium]|nr:FecR domain-containing protein [Pseudomonadota bacterium]MBU1390001.1 FecR domain-containing protein [Pseudomonadota bacterium]MBU1545048.1 FecR domain-containing protein [Pseudomonadota bacterium]MBU2430139.1 FecR domain-containing protein [Pseudomonadota bacterium]MBU2480348.1 FecR domain-containing protein [Pseudomonadota bacterium]
MSEKMNSEPVGKIVVLSGSATALSSEGTRPLEMGSPIYQNDIVKTDSGSQLQVKFIDNTQVSQAENSTLKIDSVVYNPDTADNSNLLLDMMKGTFRTISGEITKDSPTHFMLKSPQGTIGIRGTIVASQVTDLFEKHGVEELTPGKIVVIEDHFGNIRIFNVPMQLVEFYSGKPVSEVRELLLDELEEFQGQAPLSQDGTDSGDTPLGYTAPEDSFTGIESSSSIVPSDFGLTGNMVVRFNSGADLLGIFDSLEDVPGYEDNAGSDDPGDFEDFQGSNDNTGFDIVEDSDSGVVTHQGTEGDDTLTGSLSSDIMIGRQGNDMLDGRGGSDVLYGGAGDDILSIDADTFLQVDGGAGTDTLTFQYTVADENNLVNVDLTQKANDMIQGIERIDLLEGQSDTHLTLSINDILDMSDTTDRLIIDGDQGDSVTITDGSWSPPIGSSEDSYVTYYAFGYGGTLALQVDADINVNINSMVF